jgi:hypothetical protein
MSARLAVVLAALATCGVLPAAAAAQQPSPPPDAQTMGVDVRIQRFALQGNQIEAKGTASVGLNDAGGASSRASRPVVFQAQGGGSSCRVLTLSLDTLQLTLLGLRVDTSQVNLLITGQRQGGALGQLFCQLARGLRLDRKLVAARAVRSLNRRLASQPMRVIGFNANVQPSTQPVALKPPTATAAQAAPAPGSCQVLDLVLGPLNLDLLGLRVDLYGATTTQPVRVLITADPAGGVLGQVFCKLSSGQAVL